jgi:hypothetical protein
MPRSDQPSERAVNFLLPEGLSPDRYHALARKLVSALRRKSTKAGTTQTAQGGAASPDYVSLSTLSDAPPENVPILNDYTWVLTVPALASVQQAEALIREIPEAADVKVEGVVRHGISEHE